MSDRVTLLLELGCEEIPARMLPDAGADLAALVTAALGRAGIAHGAVRAMWTARRLAVHVADCARTAPERVELLLGPPAGAAWDAEGRPTRALEGFARKHGLDAAAFTRRETDKGVYAATEVRRGGENLGEVLASRLPDAVAAMSFPKSMRWGDGRFRFVRPVHWVVALANADVLPLEILGVAAGRTSRGNRTLHPGPVEIPSADAWIAALESAGVTPAPDARRGALGLALERAARGAGGSPVDDRELLVESADIVEFPGALCGSFDERYIRDLPTEVLETCLRHHQKAFLVVGQGGEPRPAFAVAVNRPDDPEGHVRRGHEWVASGRLADALFFWNEDRRRRLADRVGALEGIIFQRELGSYAAKTVRVRGLAAHLAPGAGLTAAALPDLDRAAELARADLLTGLVGEFPELQGVVGGLLARADGEPERVCAAISGLYEPASPDGPLPEDLLAQVLGLADRLDTLAGCFAVGVVPSGSKDPFALRRAGLVAVRLAWRFDGLDLADAVRAALAGFRGEDTGPDLASRGAAAAPQLLDFLFDRFSVAAPRMIPGARYDEISAVRSFARETFRARDLLLRLSAMSEFRTSDDFLALALAAKRARNILAQAAERNEPVAEQPDAGLLVLPAEQRLLREMSQATGAVDRASTDCKYAAALSALAALRPAVDQFFDEVLVMDPDSAKRRQRLALVSALHALTHRVVDLSEIVVEGAERRA